MNNQHPLISPSNQPQPSKFLSFNKPNNDNTSTENNTNDVLDAIQFVQNKTEQMASEPPNYNLDDSY